MMSGLDFMPKFPDLMMLAGVAAISACFVLPVDDDMGSIMQTLFGHR